VCAYFTQLHPSISGLSQIKSNQTQCPRPLQIQRRSQLHALPIQARKKQYALQPHNWTKLVIGPAYMHSLDTPAEINHSRALSTTILCNYKAISIYYSRYHIDHKQIEMDSHFYILHTIQILCCHCQAARLALASCFTAGFLAPTMNEQNSLEIRSGMLARGGS
jgi:hypothetical protein